MFDWRQYPETQQWVEQWIKVSVDEIPSLAGLTARMQAETGTGLQDWIDHFALGTSRVSEDELVNLGFDREPIEGESIWSHNGGLFPRLRLTGGDQLGVALKVDSVSDFLFTHKIEARIDGAPGSQWRRATVASHGVATLMVVERHGFRGFEPANEESQTVLAAMRVAEAFRLRRRDFDSDQQGFDEVSRLVNASEEQIGTDWTCSLFFAAEREYWQSRNRAARVQAERQNRLGLGWANHDHHTYRSSRENFARLVEILERLGMHCRERFYGGAEAGWGAQVLEQPVAGIVVFADVDLSPTEVTGDFAHEGLRPQSELGTVGMWCKLHGEAMLQAGMHHLECQFNFVDARHQLANDGIESMAPFSDFDYLKQSFTKGERWQVSEHRLAKALENGWISEEQATRFREQGSIGSHLEVLQRWNGYKGFNQTGISDIIRQTDPRRQRT